MAPKRSIKVRLDPFHDRYLILQTTNLLSPKVGEWIPKDQAQKMIDEGIQVVVVK